MWKAVIADDEAVIVNGLKHLIDWEQMGIWIAGSASDGRGLQELIEEIQPDLVIADIRMPHLTGIEVLRWYHTTGDRAKFIFISGYEEFQYVKEALSCGAVDYLLKPVGRRELELAVKKAIRSLEDKSTIEMFQENNHEIDGFYEGVIQDQTFDNETLEQMLSSHRIPRENHFFVGVSIGIRPDIQGELGEASFSRFHLLRFAVYNRIGELFEQQKLGFVIRKDDCALSLMGVFPKEREKDFIEAFLCPLKTSVETQFHTNLSMGIGMRCEQFNQLKNTYNTSVFAFRLYYFEEQEIIDFCDTHKSYDVSYDDYVQAVEAVFRAIITRRSDVMDRISDVMDKILSIHYGNPYAAQARTMDFTGEIGTKLGKYHMLADDFYNMQDVLQEKVEKTRTFRALRECIRKHYEQLLPEIYAVSKSKDKSFVEDVKRYIQANYDKDLSIRELAEVACVSQNYFSAMFKKETGENYKTYLTGIRMEKAMEFLQETELKTYEIGEKVGYNNVRRFVDAFKQKYGMTPMEYKKTIKK